MQRFSLHFPGPLSKPFLPPNHPQFPVYFNPLIITRTNLIQSKYNKCHPLFAAPPDPIGCFMARIAIICPPETFLELQNAKVTFHSIR